MSVTAERLMVEVRADVRQALAELGRLERQSATMGSRMGKMARSMGFAFGGAAVVSGITKTINMAKDFDLTMRQVGVQTDQTGKRLEGLSDLALKMGKDTVFSAQDAGSAMLELAKGGMSAAQIKAGALRSTLLLASAGGLDLTSSAGYMVQALTTFHLKAQQATQVATALAGGANASTASVDSLGQALSQVGPGARNAGLSLQETVAALAAFDKGGVKGSDAGTSLKTMLARLVPQTDKQSGAMEELHLRFVKANGQFRSLAGISQALRTHLHRLSDAQRTQALNTIFGSDASRAASILMDNGRKGIEKFIKATRDQSQAQDLANTNMSGAAGAVENFKGTIETAAIEMGRKFLPTVTDMLNWGTQFVNDASTWGPKVDESFGWIIDAGKNTLPVLKSLAGLVEDAASAFDSLPGPVKSTATEVLIAALVFPRLAAAAANARNQVATGFSTMSAKAKQFGAEMTYAETRTQRLGAIAKQAAGIGGLALLASAADDAEGGMRDLKRTAGLTALAFTAAGPWGAAVTAFVSIVGTAQTAGENFGLSQEEVAAQIDRVTESLNRQTGAFTKRTRQQLVNDMGDKGMLATAKELGLSLPGVTRAVMQGKEAIQQWRVRAMAKVPGDNAAARTSLVDLTESMFDMSDALRTGQRGFMLNREALGRNGKAVQKMRDDIQALSLKYHTVPKNVHTIVKAMGVDDSRKNVRALAKQYHLTPAAVRTIFKVIGADKAKAEAKGVKKGLEDAGKAKAVTKGWAASLQVGIEAGRTRAENGAKGIKRALESGPEKAKAPLGGWVKSVEAGNKPAVSIATSGGVSVGAHLKAGVIAGFAGTQARLSADAAAAVYAAIAAARHAGDIHSPSRKMAEVGHQMGRGMEVGLEKRRKHIAEQGRELVHELVRGIKESWSSAKRTLNDLAKWIRKAMAGDREARYLRKVKHAHDRLERQYAAHHRILNRLQDAQDALQKRREAKRGFVTSTREGMTSQANVLNAGNNASTIAASLVAQVGKVKEFARLLKKLRRMGYARQIIEQIAAAGVEGGMAAAKALAGASAADQASINQSYATIYKIAGNTAKALGGSMYDAGIHAAEGLVAGLRKRRKEIEQTIVDIAMAIQKAIKKALGIKSPSRVMAALGAHTGRGFANGILSQERAVAAAAARLARAAQPGAFTGPAIGVADTFARTTPATRAALTAAPSATGATFQFNTYNPVAEPQSRTTNKALARVASLGLV